MHRGPFAYELQLAQFTQRGAGTAWPVNQDNDFEGRKLVGIAQHNGHILRGAQQHTSYAVLQDVARASGVKVVVQEHRLASVRMLREHSDHGLGPVGTPVCDGEVCQTWLRDVLVVRARLQQTLLLKLG